MATQCNEADLDADPQDNPPPEAVEEAPPVDNPAPVAEENVEEDVAAEEFSSSRGPLIYTKVLVSKGEATKAVQELLASTG